MFDRPAKGVPGRIDRHHPIGFHGNYLRICSNFAAPQKIDASVVCNAEEPRAEGKTFVEGFKLSISLEKGVLNNVFTIQNRPVMREQ